MIFATRHRSPPRVAVRFAASVLMTSGVLLIADAGITVLWQEPVSAYFSSRAQQALELDLERPPVRVIRRQPLRGDAIGKIELPNLDRDYFMVEGWTRRPCATRIMVFAHFERREPASLRRTGGAP